MEQTNQSTQSLPNPLEGVGSPPGLGAMIELTGLEGIVQGADSSSTTRRPFSVNPNLYAFLNYIQIITVLSLLAFFIWFIVDFKERDKTKSFGLMEFMILFWIIRSIWSILNSAWLTTFYRAGNPEPPYFLRISITFSNIAGVVWCVAAIFSLYINPSTDKTTYSFYICKVLFWITITLYLLPKVAYLFLCGFLHFILYLMVRFNLDVNDLRPKTPNEIVEKLRVAPYKDVKEEILEAGNAGGSLGAIAVDYQTPTCSICIVELQSEDLIIIMPCDGRHYFHKECIYSWLLRSQECPICRTNVVHFMGSLVEGEKETAVCQGEN